MTSVSYPAVGADGFNEAQWSIYFDADDGIINDLTGGVLTLSRINTGEIARYSPGKIRVAGHILSVTASHDLTVSTAAGTYYTWACYEPALDVADGSGNANPLGPCYLGISSDLPSTAASKQYCLLDRITRAAAQALTATTVFSYRRWVGPSLYMAGSLPAGDLSDPEVPTTGFGPYPLGTTLYSDSLNKTYRRVVSPSGGLSWRDLTAGNPVALPLAAGMGASTAAPYYYVVGQHVYLRGTVQRTSGANLVNSGGSSDVTIGTLPVGLRPASMRRFPVYAGGATVAFMHAGSDGVLAVYAGGQNVSWVDLSSIHFQIGG